MRLYQLCCINKDKISKIFTVDKSFTDTIDVNAIFVIGNNPFCKIEYTTTVRRKQRKERSNNIVPWAFTSKVLVSVSI